MFPLKWNLLFRKKDGSLVKLGDALGGDYTLPTASNSTKGGIKVGAGLKMTGEVLSVDIEVLPEYSIADAGKVLTVNAEGNLEWATITGPQNRYSQTNNSYENNSITSKVEGGE